MPTLQFKGKNIIWNHHMSVPYHTLDRVEELDFQADKGGGNIIVEGDNLTALKALLPEYAGKVKCIYIDPPYNTGEEHWVYNDNVSSPIIKNWIGKEVGKDDLTKHDKWLCMMTPRLKLLNELLKPDDGVIFISIDDNEQANLKLLCDEIFGEESFVATIPWRKRTSKSDVPFGLSQDTEWILCYAKPNFIAGQKIERKYYYTDDYPNEGWRLSDLTTLKTPEERPNSAFVMVDPKTGKEYPYSEKRVWGVTKDTFEEYYKKGKIVFPDDYDFLNISKPAFRVFESEDKAKALQKYGTEEAIRAVSTTLPKEVGMTKDGNKEITDLFGKKVFDNAKPTTLIRYLLSFATGKNDIVLDSFAGSGTTAHAVMDLNKEDGGNRRYILVQMPENSEKEPEKNICRDITRERIVRAIEKFGYDSGFEYLRVGQALDAETLLSGELPPYETFAKYVYYLATGEHPNSEAQIDKESYFVGSKDNEDIYLIYTDDMDALQKLALSYEKAEAIRKRSGAKKAIVYAPACFLDEEDLQEMRIEFVSIPYNLFERKAEA